MYLLDDAKIEANANRYTFSMVEMQVQKNMNRLYDRRPGNYRVLLLKYGLFPKAPN